MCWSPGSHGHGHLSNLSWGRRSFSFHLQVLNPPLDVGEDVRVLPLPLLLADYRRPSCLGEASDFLSPWLMFSASSAFFPDRAHVAPHWPIAAVRFAKESTPSQTLSILDGILNPPERRVKSESWLKRPPDGQQHTEYSQDVAPDHILLHLQSMTRAAAWNIFSKYNKVMTKGKTVNDNDDEFLLPPDASCQSSPKASEQSEALNKTVVPKSFLWPTHV